MLLQGVLASLAYKLQRALGRKVHGNMNVFNDEDDDDDDGKDGDNDYLRYSDRESEESARH